VIEFRTKFRVYSTKNQVNRVKYSLDIGANITDFFEDYFNVRLELSLLQKHLNDTLSDSLSFAQARYDSHSRLCLRSNGALGIDHLQRNEFTLRREGKLILQSAESGFSRQPRIGTSVKLSVHWGLLKGNVQVVWQFGHPILVG